MKEKWVGIILFVLGGVIIIFMLMILRPGSGAVLVRASSLRTKDVLYEDSVTKRLSEANVPPVAGDDDYSVLGNQFLTVAAPGVLGNDSDADGDPLTAELDNAPAHGVLALNSDGSFTYTPESDFVGEDIFRYRGSDGSGLSNSAVVTITVFEDDTQVPIVSWISPVYDGEIYNVEGGIVLLEVLAEDDVGVESVRFYRWDNISLLYMDIGVVYSSPYTWNFDTSILNEGYNQIFAQAYDTSGNISTGRYIWLYYAKNITPTPAKTPTSTLIPTHQEDAYLPYISKNIASTPSPSDTPTPTATEQPNTTGDISIVEIFYDGASGQEPDEYVEIKNDDAKPIQLQNWTLSDAAGHVFTFPSFVFQPEQVCRVYTNEVHPEWCGFSYGSGAAIWNNSGDTATLRDGNGTLVDMYTYP